MVQKVKINRAPVLTLWATVVAERMGYAEDTALTLGKSIAGLNAQSKGRRLGIFEERKDDGENEPPQHAKKTAEKAKMVSLLGRSIPAVQTKDGLRATEKDEPIHPERVRSYLKSKFGENLAEVREVMEALAGAFPPEKLEARAYDLYEAFRPKIPEGKKGWGAAGELDLEHIRELAP